MYFVINGNETNSNFQNGIGKGPKLKYVLGSKVVQIENKGNEHIVANTFKELQNNLSVREVNSKVESQQEDFVEIKGVMRGPIEGFKTPSASKTSCSRSKGDNSNKIVNPINNEPSLSNAISESNILNCNWNFWLKSDSMESHRLWLMAQNICISYGESYGFKNEGCC